MKPETGITLSLWADTADVPKFKPLNKDIETDICIIGGGITGLTTGYLLSKEGREVTIVDDGSIGGGETARTTAHLSNVLESGFAEIEKLHGKKSARLAAQSHIQAIDTIERIVQKEKIDCDFSRLDGYLFFQPDDPADLLEKEYEAAVTAGVNVEIISKSPLKIFNEYPSLRFPSQAQFHILKYISKLAKVIVKNGSQIFTQTHTLSIKDGSRVTLKTKGKYSIKAKDATICTNSPISDYIAIHTKQFAYRTYVIGFKIPKNSVPKALYWDNENPYHYVRIYEEERNDILVIGGEDRKTGRDNNPEERFKALEEWSGKKFKNLDKVVYKWSGQVLEPLDRLGFIGKDPENPKHVYIATGFSGNGITYGTIAGLLLTDLLHGRDNEWGELYDPDRINQKDAPEFIKEGVATLSKYVEYFTPGEVDSAKEIKRGEGAIIKEGMEKVAVFRDERGRIHKFSAVCPHLKCIVQWNSVEKSWDCPCHGSRFNALGKVINGPALADMEKYEG